MSSRNMFNHMGSGEAVCLIILLPIMLPFLMIIIPIERFQKLKNDTGSYFGKYFCWHKKFGPVHVDEYYSDIRHHYCLDCGCMYLDTSRRG